MFSSIELKAKKAISSVPRTFVDLIGAFLILIGFSLVLLCVLSNQTTKIQSLYFLKVTQVVPAGSDFAITFGLYNYCILQGNTTECIEDDSIMIVPYDVNLTNKFNATYPQLFLNGTPPDQNYDPFARPNPPHNPKIYVACVLCLLSSGASFVLCVMKFTYRHSFKGFQDTYFTRGFLSAGACACALLLVSLCSVMYPNAVTQLNLTYPNIVVSLGPCVAMIGCSFMIFFISSMLLLRDCSARIEKREKDEYDQI